MCGSLSVLPPAVGLSPGGFYASQVKRPLDVMFSLIAIVLLMPVMAVVALAVFLALGRPILFFDERAGLKGRAIRIAKFRSMSTGVDSAGNLLPDSDRLGRFGRFLRRTSLDELPQLFNVLMGDMSLVGPRPLPLRYLARYNPRQYSRLLVRPGVTGLAQVRGRNAADWPVRLELDVRYVEALGGSRACLVDAGIVLATAFQICSQAITGKGVSGPGVATMKEFLP